MNGAKVLILTALVAAVIALTFADVEEDLPFDLADCKKVMARIAKRTLKAFGMCSKQLRTNVTGDREMFEKKLGCAVKCTLYSMDIINEEGQVTREKVQKFMDEMVPQDAHEFGHALTAECNESIGTKLDPSQEFCETYSEYATCMQNTLADFADKTSCHPGGHH